MKRMGVTGPGDYSLVFLIGVSRIFVLFARKSSLPDDLIQRILPFVHRLGWLRCQMRLGVQPAPLHHCTHGRLVSLLCALLSCCP
jgi:hypothetical protein